MQYALGDMPAKERKSRPHREEKRDPQQIVLERCGIPGRLVRVSEKGDFGHILTAQGEFWAHIRTNLLVGFGGSLTTFTNHSCLCAIGGDPLKWASRPSPCVVTWGHAETSELSPEDLLQYRVDALSKCTDEQICSQMRAQWYISLWSASGAERPKCKLVLDESLKKRVVEMECEARSAQELLKLSRVTAASPYYVITPKGHDTFLSSAWQTLFAKRADLTATLTRQDILELCAQQGLPEAEAHDAWAALVKQNAVAIDLESDDDKVFQYGWRNSSGTGLKVDPKGLSNSELQAVVSESLMTLQSPCIVGHNILAWDLPILLGHEVHVPKTVLIWDTLIASWIIEPWKSSHALVVEEGAHQADSDAVAAYALFLKQLEQLKPCMNGLDPDINGLVNKLFEDPSLLSKQKGRSYPVWGKNEHRGAFITPSNRQKELDWRIGCRVACLSPDFQLKNPILSPEICRNIASEKNDLLSKIVAVIVAESAAANVQMSLSMLPLWLVDDDFRIAVVDAHKQSDGIVVDTGDHLFYRTDDLFRQSTDQIEAWFKTNTPSLLYPDEVRHAWCDAYSKYLTEDKVKEEFPSAVEGRLGRALLPVFDSSRNSAWLLFEPSGFIEKTSSWRLIPSLPAWLTIETPAVKPEGNGNWVRFPKWKDGDAKRLDVDRLFVSPDTANRTLYMSDLVHSILNIRTALKGDEVLLCALRWKGEAVQIQKNLTQLSLSILHSDSALRQLESARKHHCNVVICAHAELPKYLEAAVLLQISVRVAVDEVPLHEWYALLHKPIASETSVGADSIEPMDVEDTGDDPDAPDSPAAPYQQVALKAKDIQDVVAQCLLPWVRGLLQVAEKPATPVLIMDARLHNQPTGKAPSFPWEELPFYALEELLDKRLREVYFQICFPHGEEQDIPNTYEAYRVFLQKNWGYEDFKSGTQKPAIEALINNKRDLLLRLPTGEGKSVVFHLPALLRSTYSGRLTVVVTPLRALMHDQVRGLWEKHFTESVDYLSGGRDAWLNHEVYQGVLDGRIKLIFVSPERFRVTRFTEVLERRRRMDGGLEFIVFDEVHCVSEWGFEFRPDYLYAARYVGEWFKEKDLPGNPHRLLLTSATVTQRNRADLERELGLGKRDEINDLPEDMPHPIQPFIILESCDLPESEEPDSDPKLHKILEIVSKLDLFQSAAIIFVRRRKDCHRISDALNAYAANNAGPHARMHAIPFHAGLPEDIKKEASELLRAKTVNVLVCTKAFGMGMDIPHLHACIHYRPPAFLEDYLQEVGRIGRDKDERSKTKNEEVVATLLYNQEDLERNIGVLQDMTIRPPDLQDFFNHCASQAVPFPGVNKAVCTVSAKVRVNEAKEFNENQVTNCLFWLERAKVLQVEGRHPPFLELSVNLSSLKKITNGDSLSNRVSQSLMRIVDESVQAVTEQTKAVEAGADVAAAESGFSRFIRGLSRGVLALIGISDPKNQVTPATANPLARAPLTQQPEWLDISVSMAQLMGTSGGLSVDELFLGLCELSRDKILKIRKTFIVMKNGAPSSESFWDLLEFATGRLMKSTEGHVELLSRKNFEKLLCDWYQKVLVQNDGTTTPSDSKGVAATRKVQREVYRAMNAALRIVRYAGLDVRETLSHDGITQYGWVIPHSGFSLVSRGVNERLAALKMLLQCVRRFEPVNAGGKEFTFEVLLTDILSVFDSDMRISRLQELMKLLEVSGFYGLEGALNDWVSIVSLNGLAPLPERNSEYKAQVDAAEMTTTDRVERIQRVYVDMLERHELQVLRAQCMVLFAAMPAENRKQFIDKYFKAMSSKELQQVLEDTVGDVDDEVVAKNSMLQGLLSQVRRERFQHEMDRLNDHQRQVCSASYNSKMLVNAGPGSGKTHVLMMRCAHLIHDQGIKPAEILVLAFNRAVVFEIRNRIRELFKELGYGSYVNKLDVATFHSFALRFQNDADLYEEDAIGNAVHTFAERMRTDDAFARRVAGGYKAILVDEFQDMNEDFYQVVARITSVCLGGAMVIGDDDQDILTWNRRQWARNYGNNPPVPLVAVHYFEHFRDQYSPRQFELTINYRSVPPIVSRANGMIAKVSQELKFHRMKSGVDLTAFRQEPGVVEKLAGEQQCRELIDQAFAQNTSMAVLCRSNRECRKIYESLTGGHGINRERIDLLGAEDLALYQLRPSGAIMDLCGKRDEHEFVESYIWEQIVNEYQELRHADKQDGVAFLNVMYQLIWKEKGRPRVRDVVDFIQEMRASDLDRLKAKAGLNEHKKKLTISTVHKVKGLEYDTVVILPSAEKFPLNFSADNQVDIVDSAEEARLYYVAMTRARNQLYMGWAGRETAWRHRRTFEGTGDGSNHVLKGSPKELFVSWAGQMDQVANGLQSYIEKNVRIGDRLTLANGNSLYHANRRIGLLSGPTATRLHDAVHQPEVRVANVMRYSCGRYFQEHNAGFWDRLAEQVRQQKWFYVVLVEEC